ncbi:glycoside hydrolase family 15 protein [Desulfatiferula olefinivorans]
METLDYGIIGNGTSAALVTRDGNIEWLCLPSFESPSVFAALLDRQRGGDFGFDLPDGYAVTQSYIPKTNVLVTRYEKGPDRFEVIDFMPLYKTDTGRHHCPPDLIRFIRHLSGAPEIRIRYRPRPIYSQHDVITTLSRDYIKTVTAQGSYESFYLYSSLDHGAIAGHDPIVIDKDAFLLFSYNQKLEPLHLDTIILEFEKTKVYWLSWSSKSGLFPRFNEEILRSALVLKLLAYQKTGAILAAVTTSLPEEIGAERNWDYRFCWLRDASMTMTALTRLGHYNVARRYIEFILGIIPFKDEKIQIMYGIKGQKRLTEKILTSLCGYENTGPVRVGNAAYMQKQNDIYGVMLDCIYQYLKIFKREAIESREELWTVVRTLARHVEANWRKKDRGIWEFRKNPKHFTFSKVLCWVAIDRARLIAQYFSRDDYVEAWETLAATIRNDILRHGWHKELGAFSQSYGEPFLDAANLLMEHYGFISADDHRYVKTVRLTEERLCRNGLMYRYRTADDFGVPKSSFTVCTFWLIKSLYKIGETDKAEKMFADLLSYSNHLGLYSEDLDFETKRLLGNFPQGYSHLALIDTALTLSGLSGNGG